MKMKRLLLPLLASLALPTAVNANTWDDAMFKNTWPRFFDNFNNGVRFRDAGDYQMTCESFIKANNALTDNFALFQRYKPSMDFFKYRRQLKAIVEDCNASSIY
tara:strand:+ start:236 stop:547 length:312 start_codon:yes stop_codon:yes gene_type:complete